MYVFDYDPEKSQTNFKKHGIDFVQAQELWSDPNLPEVQAKSDDESRYLMIGLISTKHWSAIDSHRQDSKVGATRQSIIKVWLAERLEETGK